MTQMPLCNPEIVSDQLAISQKNSTQTLPLKNNLLTLTLEFNAEVQEILLNFSLLDHYVPALKENS